ncbi:class I SAM-dependent methyltransferase [Malonomonas rubra]|uniref:class I SAM-dependent methyltransferase n=1 Tax=Malonomonas rubra TaxID=57040 RepID=UPI0026EF14C4|nr:class I SAM-dependent methyltransferase [Malonomonas rubra]
MDNKVDWDKIKSGREKAYRQLSSQLNLPLVKGHRELLLKYLYDGAHLLDVGANDRSLKSYIDNKSSNNIFYFSCDVDTTHKHEYYSVDECKGKYNVITVFEVIEHLQPGNVFALLNKCYELLSPGGVILVSTPNVHHPVRFWRDCTHITPFSYDELAGILITIGFDGCVAYRTKTNMGLRKKIVAYVCRPLISLLGIDYATGIVVIGSKS